MTTATRDGKKPDAPAGDGSDDQLMDDQRVVTRSDDEAAVSAAADQFATLSVKQERADGNSDETEADDDDDPDLWKPHPPREECPVCLAPLPINGRGRTYYPCCGKQVCTACDKEHMRATYISNAKRVQKELPPQPYSCAFCRVAHPKSNEESRDRVVARISKGDAFAVFDHALFDHGLVIRDGQCGLPKNESKAIELFQQSAELGCVDAISEIGVRYTFGIGLPTDVKRGLKYLKDAAKKGHVTARKNLAIYEDRRGNTQLAIRHRKLSAAAGDPDCMKTVWQLFLCGKISKAEVEDVLRANKDACDEMKTDDRDRCNSYVEARDGNDEILTRLYRSYYRGEIKAKELDESLKAHRCRR